MSESKRLTIPVREAEIQKMCIRDSDTTVFEKEPLQRLAAEGQLMSFHHTGFWQCMDTQREMQKLEALWQTGAAPWKIWEN